MNSASGRWLMRSMSKRQNAGEYNNGLPLMSSNPGAIGRSPHSATLSLSRSRLRTHFSPPAFVQSYRIRIKARARTPSRRGTIFLLVRGMYNSRNLGSLKRVSPLRLSLCCGAPSLDIARLCSPRHNEPRQSAIGTERAWICIKGWPPRRVTKNTCCDRMEGASRLRENYVGTRELRGSTRVAQQQDTPAGCSKRPSSKAAGELKPEAYPLGYVEDFDEPRTTLADFFSILLETVSA